MSFRHVMEYPPLIDNHNRTARLNRQLQELKRKRDAILASANPADNTANAVAALLDGDTKVPLQPELRQVDQEIFIHNKAIQAIMEKRAALEAEGRAVVRAQYINRYREAAADMAIAIKQLRTAMKAERAINAELEDRGTEVGAPLIFAGLTIGREGCDDVMAALDAWLAEYKATGFIRKS